MKLGRLLFALMYLRRAPWDSGITPPELLEYMKSHPPGRAIDLGCGTGTNVLTLAQNGWQVTGVDFVPRAVRMAKQKLGRANLVADIRLGDVTNLKGIQGPFDLALDIGCFHGVRNKASYLDELERILAPRGHWLLYGFFKSTPEMTGVGLTEQDVAQVARRGFRLLKRTDGFDRQERRSAWFLFERGS